MLILKKTFRICSGVARFRTFCIFIEIWDTALCSKQIVFSLLLFIHKFEKIFVLFASSKFFEHDHFILAVLRGLSKKLLFLILLGHIDDRWPVLFIFSFEVFEKFIETRITFCHTFYGGIERFSWFWFLRLNEVL